MHQKSFFIGLVCVIGLAGCGAINQSIEIADGSQVEDDVSTVNGSIRIGSACTIEGDISNVNGSISIGRDSAVQSVANVNGSVTLGDSSSARELKAVNGSIKIGQLGRVSGSAATVNGRIELGAGASVDGELTTVNGGVELKEGASTAVGITTINGTIRLEAARAGRVETVAGSIYVEADSIVEGELRVRKPQRNRGNDIPQVVIGPGARVVGPLVFEREVRLQVHETADIGQVEGAQVERYAGEQP